jgi:hypothetical protein
MFQVNRNLRLILFVLGCWLLACTPLSRLAPQKEPAREAVVAEQPGLMLAAYEKLRRLPGYRLESQRIVRGPGGQVAKLIMISEQDKQGNSHIWITPPEGQALELVVVAGRTYIFETQYNGWVEATAENNSAGDIYAAGLEQLVEPIRQLSQLDLVPVKMGQESWQSRAVTHYQLQAVGVDLAAALGVEVGQTPVELQGAFWVDQNTGALLKAELLFYEGQDRQASQELLIHVTQVGQIEPVAMPAPVVNPAAMVAGTATAQAWLTFPAELDYLETPVTFEITPLKTQAGDDINEVEMQFLLRRLPAHLLQISQAELFLDYLQQKLQLSLPEHNLVILSHDFRLDHIDSQAGSVEATFFFEVDLAEFDQVELILAGSGNPLLMTVPVERTE